MMTKNRSPYCFSIPILSFSTKIIILILPFDPTVSLENLQNLFLRDCDYKAVALKLKKQRFNPSSTCLGDIEWGIYFSIY